MTTESGGETLPIESHDALVSYLESGCKPRESWRIGTEHEKFGFHTDDFSPLPYEGAKGVEALLNGLVARFDWVPIFQGENVVGLKQRDGPHGGAVSLEPGGQFELSGAPLKTLHETCDEVHTHLHQVREVGDPLGISFLGLGFSPKWRLDETPRMPKGRYEIMSAYMPKVGRLGLDMMYRSCTVQVNLDFSDEADMVKKLRVSLALQPVATALFANSPFKEGKPNGFMSYRSEVWRDTDPDRTGMLPFVFEDGMGFERYVDYALDAPMYFVYRDGKYIDATEITFRQFLRGDHPDYRDLRPTLSDWSNHLTTLFPEVRLKTFLEMRGADGGPWRRLCALPALWVGLLYQSSALDAAWNLVKDWSEEERQTLRDQVPKTALATPFRGGTLLEVARTMVSIARDGLAARGLRDSIGNDETKFLETLESIVAEGRCPARQLLESFHGDWGGNIDRVFMDCAY
jgi:glutamate--cysteine ligase